MASRPGSARLLADPMDNAVYCRVPRRYRDRWSTALVPVELNTGTSLYEPGDRVAAFHFPTTAVVSMTSVSTHGETALMGMVGFEGVIGLPALMSGEATVRAVVQNSGTAFQLDAGLLAEAFHQDREVREQLLRYVQVYLTQVGQVAVCSRHHSVDSRLCTLLLRTIDRARRTELAMTHELLGALLGCRRETVSHAALRLHEHQVFTYHRGHIHVADRAALERRACECYTTVEKSYFRLWMAPGSAAIAGSESVK